MTISHNLVTNVSAWFFWNMVNFVDFSLIYVSQGSVATYVRYGTQCISYTYNPDRELDWRCRKLLLSRVAPDLEIQIRPDPESDPHLGEHFLGSQNNMPDKTNGINNAFSCYKRGSTVQCFLCYVTDCQFWTTFLEWQLIF